MQFGPFKMTMVFWEPENANYWKLGLNCKFRRICENIAIIRIHITCSVYRYVCSWAVQKIWILNIRQI